MPKKEAEKMCQDCREVKPMSEFYVNHGWKEQGERDIYCKECARKRVHDKESARKYCWDNNRVWSDDMWKMAQKKALYS